MTATQSRPSRHHHRPESRRMRAVHAYVPGDPTRLVLEEAPIPSVEPGDVLVRVHASGVTPSELEWPSTWLTHDGAPRTPPIVPGHEVAGVVEELGPGSTGLAVGDAVYGLIDFRRDGADAEFVVARAAELAVKPEQLSFREAAAVPLSALTAWQALFEHGQLAAGERVLIHGAAGGVGIFAVQLARWRGARVAATSSARDADVIRALGADRVIDYRSERFEDVVEGLDLVIDTVGGETWERSWAALRPGGRLVSVAVPRPPDRPVASGRRSTWFVVRSDAAQLREIGSLLDAGHLRVLLAATLGLARAAEAYGPAATRRGAGKSVLVVADPDPGDRA